MKIFLYSLSVFGLLFSGKVFASYKLTEQREYFMEQYAYSPEPTLLTYLLLGWVAFHIIAYGFCLYSGRALVVNQLRKAKTAEVFAKIFYFLAVLAMVLPFIDAFLKLNFVLVIMAFATVCGYVSFLMENSSGTRFYGGFLIIVFAIFAISILFAI